MLDPREKALDVVPLFVENFVVASFRSAIALGRNHCLGSRRFDSLDDSVAIIAFVPNDKPCRDALEQVLGFCAIVNVAWSHLDLEWATLRINARMDFRGTASARYANSVSLDPPFPPALCW